MTVNGFEEEVDDVDLEVPNEVPRWRAGRPLIAPRGLTPAECHRPTKANRDLGLPLFVDYTRVSTMAKALDNQTAIEGFRARMTGRGVAMNLGLQAAFCALDDLDDPVQKREANTLADRAQDVAGANVRRDVGSAIHRHTELWDSRLPIGPVPEQFVPDVRAYIMGTNGFEMRKIEVFTVNDEWKVAGTPDRLAAHPSYPIPRIADLKTGRDVLQYAQLSIAAQMASYAFGEFYDYRTGERTPIPCDVETGIVWHVPAGEGVCRTYEVDLATGREAVEVAIEVRRLRAAKNLFVQIDEEPTDLMLHQLIEEAHSRARLNELVTIFHADWREEHTSHGRDRARELQS